MSNTNKKSFIANLISNPTSFAILVLSVVIIVVWLDQRGPGNSQEAATPMTPSTASGTAGQDMAPFALSPPSINSSNTPKIVGAVGGGDGAAGKLQAPDLGGLLAGLEAKVASDPADVGKRLLLAQTYNELGMSDKALVELRDMNSKNPDQSRVGLVLASILSSSDKEADVKESLGILEKLKSDDTVKQYLVDLYKGNAMIRSQNHDGALASWKKALAAMPEADNRKTILEKRIADLTNKGEGDASQKQTQETKG